MGKYRQHLFAVKAALFLRLATLGAFAGCWEEIEYTGPDPSQVARRHPPASAEPPELGAAVSPVEAEPPAAANAVAPSEEPLEFDIGTASNESEGSETNAVEEHEPADEDSGSEDFLLDELQPEQTLADEANPPSTPETATPTSPVLSTRAVAWQLGSKLTLAALANDRGLVPADVAEWFDDARQTAALLGTSVADLPAPSAESAASGSAQVHDYLFQQGQRIWQELSDRYGPDHAALFEVAVRSNVLLVLYQPGSTAVDALANSIRQASPRAQLPPELWQPLLDTLAKQPAAAEVRAAVRRMHSDVERFLSDSAGQE